MEKEQKCLVVYFSYIGDILNLGVVKKGNNEFIAKYIGDYMKADFFRLEDPIQYPDRFKQMKEFANNFYLCKKILNFLIVFHHKFGEVDEL